MKHNDSNIAHIKEFYFAKRVMLSIHERNIVSSICDLYQRSNRTISDTLDRLYSSFCIHMYMYGCELWNLSSNYTDKYIIALRKITGKLI